MFYTWIVLIYKYIITHSYFFLNLLLLSVIIVHLLVRTVIIIIKIKGHSLRRACLQPATNTQSSKPRPPTANAKSKGKLQNKTLG